MPEPRVVRVQVGVQQAQNTGQPVVLVRQPVGVAEADEENDGRRHATERDDQRTSPTVVLPLDFERGLRCASDAWQPVGAE